MESTFSLRGCLWYLLFAIGSRRHLQTLLCGFSCPARVRKHLQISYKNFPPIFVMSNHSIWYVSVPKWLHFAKGYCRKLETQHCHFVSHDPSYHLIVVKILFPH